MKILVCSILLLFFLALPLSAYSVLTHEAIIDAVWDDSIRPLLLQRFPNGSDEELREARKYAYGGSVIQDMGYYPFGSKFFSDLIHYVRSGDFVENLLRESHTIQEYGFALGALSHYSADSIGHPLATNRSVPILYPELRRKYGNIVTFDEKPSAHLKVEFGYDVVQVARGSYLSDSFHDFIGFGVAKEVLERAFRKTYSIELNDVFGNLDLAIGTFRYTIRGLIPNMTKVAWELKKDEIQKLRPKITLEQFSYLMPRKTYKKEWGTQYKKPGFFTRVLTFFFRIVPKIGPLKSIGFKPPTPEVEKMFLDSYAIIVERYRTLLSQEKAKSLRLLNTDLDTGATPYPGEYARTDKTYAKLLDKLSKKSYTDVSPELRENILQFYSDLNAPIETKKHSGRWKKLVRQINELRSTSGTHGKM